jgi:hypothetical protein
MPAYNFQPIFGSAVECGWKRQTIRAKRKNRPRVGQTSYCFTGMRTKKCRRLGAWPIKRVRDVRIMLEGVLVDGAAVRANKLDYFAQADGFSDWTQLLVWFKKTHGFPFHGDLVMW